MPPILRNYKPVTAERFKKPEDGDWLTIRRTYDGWGYSPLDQITPANVARLQPAWVFSTGVTNGHEAPPMVNNGVMFVATPGNQVIAIDAKTGGSALALPPAAARGRHPASSHQPRRRLVSRQGFFAAGEAVLVALDARTGKEVWTATVADNKKGTTCRWRRSSPTARCMVGASGGEMGIRGFVAAYDADTGKEVWKTFTVPVRPLPKRNLFDRRKSSCLQLAPRPALVVLTSGGR